MAVQTAGPSPLHSGQVVGNAFAEQYYKVLLTNPDIVHKFYQDSSVLSRQLDTTGMMTSVTTMKGIQDMFKSLDYRGCMAQITTVDTQDSYNKGILVLVTGCLTGKDNVKRSFVQTFFLAPHATGYYVLNDVLRFVDVTSSKVDDAVIEDMASAALTSNQESLDVSDEPAKDHSTLSKDTSNGSEVQDLSNLKGSVDSRESLEVEAGDAEQPVTSSLNGECKVAASNGNNTQKISYASVVAKETTMTSSVQIPTNIIVVAPSSMHQQQQASATPKAPAFHATGGLKNISTHGNAPAFRGTGTQKSGSTYPDVKGIFVGNLPSDVSAEQLDAIFSKFGPVKKKGIQIRTFTDGFCYAFVEFESANSARSAIGVHYIMIGLKEAYVTEKKSNSQAGNGRGRFPSGKGEFRNYSYRNRQNSGEGYGDGRYPDGNHGEFSRRTRGPSGRNGEASQRVYQNRAGRSRSGMV
ncbi:RNA helicase [Bertholletia excelsa]